MNENYKLLNSQPQTIRPSALKLPSNPHELQKYTQEENKSIKVNTIEGNSSDDSNDEWTSTPPQYYNVKTTSMQALESYKYITTYKHNKKSGRTVRYFICQYEG